MINTDPTISAVNFRPASNSVQTFYFDMSEVIKIEKRVVTSLPGFFGDIGGLRDFISTGIVLLIGPVQSYAFIFDQAQTFFRVAKAPKRKSKKKDGAADANNPNQKVEDLFELSLCLRAKIFFSSLLCVPCLSRQERKVKVQLDQAEEKLGKALDTRTIVKYQR